MFWWEKLWILFHSSLEVIYTVSQKKGAMKFWQYLCQTLTDFQNYFTVGKRMKFPTKPVQNSQHSLMMLLHCLVKCTTHYYCTVNNNALPNDQQTLIQFIDILNTQHMLLMMPQIVYMTPDWGRGWVMWWYVFWCCLLQKPDSVSDFVCEAAVLLKDKEFSRQLTSGTRMCELACMLNWE